jgi:hypothetical protein
MRFTSEQRLDDGVLEREFTLGEIPGVLWTPGSASTPSPYPPAGRKGGPGWRAALDVLLALPEIGGPVGYSEAARTGGAVGARVRGGGPTVRWGGGACPCSFGGRRCGG